MSDINKEIIELALDFEAKYFDKKQEGIRPQDLGDFPPINEEDIVCIEVGSLDMSLDVKTELRSEYLRDNQDWVHDILTNPKKADTRILDKLCPINFAVNAKFEYTIIDAKKESK